MGCEEAEWLVFLMNKTSVFSHELPERLNVAELLDIVQGGIVFLIQTCRKHRNEDILCRAGGKTCENSHDVNMELQRCLVFPSDFAQLCHPVLVAKEGCV